MERNLSNKVNMCRTSLNYLDDHTAITGTIPAFAGVITTAKNKLVLITQLDQLVISGTKGVTLDVNLLRSTMTDIALKVGDAVSAYATSIHNNTLKQKVSFTLAGLSKFKKDEVANVCQTIHDEGQANLADAGDWGYSATDLTDLSTSIGLYRASVQDPRQTLVSISEAVANMKLLMKEIIDTLLVGQIDRLVRTFKRTEPVFVGEYKRAREIINIGSTTAKVRGMCTDKEDEPLANVEFTIYEAGTLTVVKKVVSKDTGRYSASGLIPGNYDFKWSLTGHRTVKEDNVHISAGKEIKRNVVMKPLGGTLVKEADVAAGTVMNINVTNIHTDLDSTVKVEVTGGPLRFYVADSINGEPGDKYVEFQDGDIREETIQQFATELGFEQSDDPQFLNVKNVGTGSGHYKMTIKGIQQ